VEIQKENFDAVTNCSAAAGVRNWRRVLRIFKMGIERGTGDRGHRHNHRGGFVPAWRTAGVGRLSFGTRSGKMKIESWEKSMKRSAKDKAKGTYHELKGTVKQKVGKAMNNRQLQAEGLGEKLAGRLQKGIGQAEKALEKR
jgi:uncharacterized protein YjbJ (UPF0337 family)